MVKIIVTGFGKFGNIVDNPTTKLVELLKDDPNVHETHVLEVSADGVRAALEPMWQHAAENADEPTVFLHMGVNAGGKQIDLEQFGYNLANFGIPDERGWVANNETITENEAASLETSLPLEKLLAHCTEQGCKMAISNDPGRYICNYTYFLSLSQTKGRPNHYALFVHVPSFTVQPQEEQLHAVKTLVAAMHATL
ncbi:hypothetical protein H310_05018 [Aphanomyces invadans]|uniref:Pyroglutamyl-peptidase I n=1 Tax=Aphanomyces invadans TaxID=157072 RepID=A0A024UBF9_9STRA|nr:hypothetical protein H310_05018 [Aphanomyces invadans]ETW03614.1 hypothetical protein H310_05018 [Aphanomyces invadans]|eukprot:XP_008867843.1 hypothetical protein H310_05018 [Aphanomyces invadans]